MGMKSSKYFALKDVPFFFGPVEASIFMLSVLTLCILLVGELCMFYIWG